jgi:hypothetical protein
MLQLEDDQDLLAKIELAIHCQTGATTAQFGLQQQKSRKVE